MTARDRIGIYQMAGDRQRALSWYRRARDLGDAEAVPGSESEAEEITSQGRDGKDLPQQRRSRPRRISRAHDNYARV